MKRRILAAVALAAAACLAGQAHADVKPHALFSDGMVLQRGAQCPVWGTAAPGEKVSVIFKAVKPLTTAASTAAVEADQNGKWRVALPVAAEMAGGPYTLVIKGNNTITLKDVYVGEVWICSGQSNMEMSLNGCHNAKETIENAKNPMIRLFTVSRTTADKPLTEVKGQWSECNPSTVANFSGVAYYFGRDLQKALNVPVGLIHTSWGGTRAEAWTSRPVLEGHDEWKGEVAAFDKAKADHDKAMAKYKADLEKYKEAVKKAKDEGKQPPPAPKRRAILATPTLPQPCTTA